MPRKLYVYIAASLDGYIAKNDDDITFLSLVEQPGEDYGYAGFIDTIDTVIIGRKTFDKIQAMGIEYLRADKEYHIVTRTPRVQEGNIRFHTGDLKTLIEELKQQDGKHIFVDGGAEVVNQLIAMDLVDEYIVSLIPILLGDGIRLFQDGRPEQNLTFVSSKSFEKGLVQLHYTRR